MSALAAFLVAVCATVMPPCPTEDSINCVWDGPTYGNSQGATFVDIDGTPYFLELTP